MSIHDVLAMKRINKSINYMWEAVALFGLSLKPHTSLLPIISSYIRNLGVFVSEEVILRINQWKLLPSWFTISCAQINEMGCQINKLSIDLGCSQTKFNGARGHILLCGRFILFKFSCTNGPGIVNLYLSFHVCHVLSWLFFRFRGSA